MKQALLNDALKIFSCTAIVTAAYISVNDLSYEPITDYTATLEMDCDNYDHDFSAYTETNKCTQLSGEDIYITRIVGDNDY